MYIHVETMYSMVIMYTQEHINIDTYIPTMLKLLLDKHIMLCQPNGRFLSCDA